MAFTYQKTEDGQMIYRKEDKAFIPYDSENNDYKEYLAWVAEGNTIEEYDGITVEEAEKKAAEEAS